MDRRILEKMYSHTKKRNVAEMQHSFFNRCIQYLILKKEKGT